MFHAGHMQHESAAVPAGQSELLGTLTSEASDVYGVSSSPEYHKCLPEWQMATVLIKVFWNYTNRIFSSIYECGFFFFFCSDSVAGLAGVDCSVVCPLIELSCLRGCCSKLSKVLSVMGVDLENTSIVLIFVFFFLFSLTFSETLTILATKTQFKVLF